MKSIFVNLSIAFFICITGCKKEDAAPTTNAPSNTGNNNQNSPGDVYICGSENVGSDPYPRYWKNGEEFEVVTANRAGSARCIWVNDQHVFIGGQIREVGSVSYQPCYWIDNEFYELPNDAGSAFCTIRDIYVKNEDEVFTAGHIRDDSGFNKAMYWNASNASELTNGSTDAEAHGIWVEGNDVYVCGFEKTQAFGGRYVAKYWVNGVPVILGSGEEHSYAYDVRVVNGDVIVVGSDADVADGEEQAVVWVNGVRSVLTTVGGAIFSVFNVGENLYFGGEIIFGGESQPTYWVNYQPYQPYLPPGSLSFGPVMEVFVFNNAIHTLGGLYTNNATNTYVNYGTMSGLYIY